MKPNVSIVFVVMVLFGLVGLIGPVFPLHFGAGSNMNNLNNPFYTIRWFWLGGAALVFIIAFGKSIWGRGRGNGL